MDVIETLVPIFGLIFLGMFVYRMDLFSLASSTALNQFTYKVALPSLLFNQLVRIDKHQITITLLCGSLIAIFITYIFSYLFFAFVLRKNRKERVILTLLSTFYNAGFMGIPIMVLLFPGDMAVAAISVLITIFSVCVLLVADAQLQYIEGAQRSFGDFIQTVGGSLFRNPTVLAAIIGALWNFLGIPLPLPLLRMTMMLGSAAAPCALFCIGMLLMSQLSTSEGFVKGWFLDHLSLHIIKLVVQPAIVYFCLVFLGESGKIIGVIVLLTCMPAGIAAYIISEKHHAHLHDTSLEIFVNTMLSIITIPVAVYLLRQAGNL